MESLADILKLLLDDFVRLRWGDLVAIWLIIMGVALVLVAVMKLQSNPTIEKLGTGLVSAGLFALRPVTMKGNGNGKPPEITKP